MNINFDKLQGSDKIISLIENKFTEDMKIESIPPLVWIERDEKIVHLGARGEVTIFFGGPKSGKSVTLEMIAGLFLKESGILGPFKRAEDAKNILYIDMEQGVLEWAVAMNRVMKYSGVTEIPSNFLSLCFTAESVGDRMFYLSQLLEAIDKVDVVILDGVADLVESESDSTLVKNSSEELKSLAVKHDCLIIGILHTDKQRKGPRDHIGSKYEKIASTLVRVEKMEYGNLFSLKPYMSRHSGDWESINFILNSENKMVDFRDLEESKDFKGGNFVNRNKSANFVSEEIKEGISLISHKNEFKNIEDLKSNL